MMLVVGDDVWPAVGDGEGERGDEKLAVAVGLGAIPAAGGPVKVAEVLVAADMHVACEVYKPVRLLDQAGQ